jgi:hypothetical protein
MTAPGARPITTLFRLGGRGVQTELARGSRAGRRGGVDAPVIVQRHKLSPKERTARHALVELAHPNLGVVEELVDEGKESLLVSAYVEGESLDALRAAAPEHRLPLGVELRIALDVLAGIGALHALSSRDPSAARLHGQLDPRNVIVEPAGRAVVVQLGGPIPLLAEDAWLRYLAPELLLADDTVDHRIDIYSVGVMLWESLSAAPFVPETSPNAILVRHLSGKIGAPTVPADAPWAAGLVPLVVRAVSTDPSARFENAGVFAEAIRAAVGDHVASAEDVARTVAAVGGSAIEARRARLAKLAGPTPKAAAPVAPAAPGAPAAAPPARTPAAPPPKLQLPAALRIGPAASPWAAASAAAQLAPAAAASKAPAIPAPAKPVAAVAASPAVAVIEASDVEVSPPSQRMTTPAPQPPPPPPPSPTAQQPASMPIAVSAAVAAAPTPAPPARTAPNPPPPSPAVTPVVVAIAAPPVPAPVATPPIVAPIAPLPARTQLAIAPPAPVAPPAPAPLAPPPPALVAPPAPVALPEASPPAAEDFEVLLGPPSVPPISAHAKSDPAGPAVVPSVPPPPPTRRSRGLLIALALLGLLGITFAAIRLGGRRDETAPGTQTTSASATTPSPNAVAKTKSKSTTLAAEPTVAPAADTHASEAQASGSGGSTEPSSSAGATPSNSASALPADDAGGARGPTPNVTPTRPDKPSPKPKSATPYDPLGI